MLIALVAFVDVARLCGQLGMLLDISTCQQFVISTKPEDAACQANQFNVAHQLPAFFFQRTLFVFLVNSL